MTYLRPGVVHLHFAEEIASSYHHYDPVAHFYTVERPYQGGNASAAAIDSPQQEVTGELPPEGNQQGAALHQVTQRRRRKRQKTLERPDRPREQEARERHRAVEGFLTEAHLTLRKSLTQARDAAPRQDKQASDNPLQPFGCPALDSIPAGHKVAAADEEAESLDLLGLAELKFVLKPKLLLQHAGRDDTETGTADLFDQLHRNPRDEEVVADAFGVPVLVPACCSFLLSDVARLQPLLAGAPAEGFDCIVMDPPWENASARRGSKYPALPSRKLLSVPVPRLLHKERGLLALWVTNRERLRAFVDRELLPAWGLELVATWHWVKVTDGGELVSPMDTGLRRPYEPLLLARPVGSTARAATAAGADGSSAQQQLTDLAIFAVPGQHSRKPHLGRLLAPHLPCAPSLLEMFARELAAGWTSWGNEVLKFQMLENFVARTPGPSLQGPEQP